MKIKNKKNKFNFLFFILLSMFHSILLSNTDSINTEQISESTKIETSSLEQNITDNSKPVFFSSEVLQISDHPALNSLILLADKKTRKLYFFNETGEIKLDSAVEIDIGKNSGNKIKKDDKRTPEGIYLLQTKKTQPEIPFDLYGSMAITTDYPNVFDKFENKSGSGIWLHSVPDKVPLNRGSRGCVVVKNDIIQSIADKVSLNKSFLIINDQLTRIEKEEHDQLKKGVIDWLETWRQKWESQNIEEYIKFYSSDFSAPEKFNIKTWEKHKQNLKKIYNSVTIKLSPASIFHVKNQYLIKFVQNYKSDKHEDEGIKTLYVLEKNNKFEILREEWTAFDSTAVTSN